MLLSYFRIKLWLDFRALKLNRHNVATMCAGLKFKFIIGLILCLTENFYSSDITVTVNPNPSFVGETGQYKIASTVGKPNLKSLPEVDGIKWVENGPHVGLKIINFKRTDTLTYEFTFIKPGTHAIPPVEVQVGNRVLTTNPIKLSVQERQFRGESQNLTLDELVFLKISYNEDINPPQKIYLGEEITLTIKLYVDHRLEIYADKFDQSKSFTSPNNYFPTLNLDNVVYRDYSDENQYNSKFLYKDGQSDIVEQRRFQVFTYQSGISGIEVGDIKGRIEHTIPIVDPNRKRGNRRDPFDDFFRLSGLSRRNQIFTHQVQATIHQISVLSVPTDQLENGFYLGLVGMWKVQLTVDQPTASVGEDVTLTLNVQGTGNIASLSAPKLEIPGFRIYPPEMNRKTSSESHGSIKWVIIPLNASSQFPSLKFKTFNPKSEKFDTYEFHPTLKVKPAEKQPAGPIIEDFSKKSKKGLTKSRKIHRASDILYIKKELGQNTRLPLWKNVRFLVVSLALFGPMCYFTLVLLTIRKEKLEGSLSFKRRRDALRNRRRIFREIRQASPDDIPRVISEDLIPFLKAIMDLPPGATSTELLERITDKDLIEILKQAEIGGFMPGQATQIDPYILLKKVKNLLIIIFCFILSNTGICEDLFTVAGHFYDQGNIEEAEGIYQDLLENNLGNSALLFNLGNCAYRRGDYGNSIVYYERARRLKPRDSDIVENLNFVRSQLNLPPVQSSETPLELVTTLRDQMRPDAWLICAGASWSIIWIILSIHRVKRYSLLFLLSVISVILLVSLGAYFSQLQGTYSKNQAVVVAQKTPIFRLPRQSDGGKAKFVLNVGDSVAIIEQRSDWSRIRIDQDEGWVQNNAIGSVW